MLGSLFWNRFSRGVIDWLERWSQERHRELPWDSWQDPPRDIVEEYDRTNSDRH